MKFVAIADTHGQHSKLVLPKGDALLHAGDVSMNGSEDSVIDFLEWVASQDFKYKIFIAGNHDFYFERASQGEIEKIIPPNITYLYNESVSIEGVNIWGSPITPWFLDWAFNRHRGAAIQRYWDLIPANTNILLTHGPVAGILDKTTDGYVVGCIDLLNKVNEIKPAFHVCGHIHEAYGMVKTKGTTFINASVLDENYKMVNPPVVFEL